MKAYINIDSLHVVAISDQVLDNEYLMLEIPEGLDQDCLKAVLVDDVITLIEDPVLVAAKAKSAKAAQVAELKAASDKDILDGMAALYGTTNETSATATYLTWQDQIANPAAYVGTVFPNANAVTNYATEKIAAARIYAKFRMERIEQFKADKAALA